MHNIVAQANAIGILDPSFSYLELTNLHAVQQDRDSAVLTVITNYKWPMRRPPKATIMIVQIGP